MKEYMAVNMDGKKVDILVIDFTLRGGIERFVANLSQALLERGKVVEIYSFHKTYDEPLYTVSDEVKVTYITSLKFREKFYKASTFYACLKYCFFIHKNSSTVVSTHPITSIFCALLSSKIASKLIASEHSTYSAHGKFVRNLRKYAYAKLKSITTQTHDGCHSFNLDNLIAKRIPNPVCNFSDPLQWQPKSLANDSLRCLVLARLEKIKQLDHIVEVASYCSQEKLNVVIDIVGSGPQYSYLQELIANKNIGHIIKLTDAVRDVRPFYRDAALYLITSKSEAFPMSMIEAMSYGMPVLSYDELIGPREVIVNGTNGYLCQQNNPKEVFKKLNKIIQNPSLYRTLSLGAIESSKKFDLNIVGDSWIELIEHE